MDPAASKPRPKRLSSCTLQACLIQFGNQQPRLFLLQDGRIVRLTGRLTSPVYRPPPPPAMRGGAWQPADLSDAAPITVGSPYSGHGSLRLLSGDDSQLHVVAFYRCRQRTPPAYMTSDAPSNPDGPVFELSLSFPVFPHKHPS